MFKRVHLSRVKKSTSTQHNWEHVREHWASSKFLCIWCNKRKHYSINIWEELACLLVQAVLSYWQSRQQPTHLILAMGNPCHALWHDLSMLITAICSRFKIEFSLAWTFSQRLNLHVEFGNLYICWLPQVGCSQFVSLQQGNMNRGSQLRKVRSRDSPKAVLLIPYRKSLGLFWMTCFSF